MRGSDGLVPIDTGGNRPGEESRCGGLGWPGTFCGPVGERLGRRGHCHFPSPSKKGDALKLGAKESVVSKEEGWEKSFAFAFDFVLHTADMTHELDITKYLSLCNVNATFHQVGLPDEALPPIKAQMFMSNGSFIGTSHVGNRPECLAMLKLAAEKKLFPMVETLSISEAGCKEAVSRVADNKIKYRFTLTDYDKAFGSRS